MLWLTTTTVQSELLAYLANEARTYLVVESVVDLGFLKGGRVFSTALVRAHEAGDACAQNDKKGGSAEPKEPPWIRHCEMCVSIM